MHFIFIPAFTVMVPLSQDKNLYLTCAPRSYTNAARTIPNQSYQLIRTAGQKEGLTADTFSSSSQFP